MSHDLRFSCDGVTVGTPGASILMQNGNGTGTGWLDAVFIAACSFAPFPALQRKVNQAYETIREQKPLFPMTPRPDGVIRYSGLEKTVPGPRQSKILSQGDAFVFTSKDISCLQFGHDLVDEIVESARQIGEHHVETIRSVLHEPLLHLICNHLGRTDHFKPRITADPLRELADREIVAARPFDHALAAAFACVRFRYLGQRSVGIEA